MRESAEFSDDVHVHTLQVCCHLQHHVVRVVGKTQIFAALGKTLFTHHVLACAVVVDGENIRFHKFDDVSRAKLQVLICKNYILFAFIKSLENGSANLECQKWDIGSHRIKACYSICTSVV